MRVDTLTIDAVVTDRFSDNLEDFRDKLADVAEVQPLVDERMDINVNVRGLGKLTALNTELAALSTFDADRDIDIGTLSAGSLISGEEPDVFFDDDGNLRDATQLAGGDGGSPIGRSVDINAGIVNVNGGTIRGGGVGGGVAPDGAVGDGGDGGDDDDRDGMFFDTQSTIGQAQRIFGDAFDFDALIDRGDRLDARDLLAGNPSEFIDERAFARALSNEGSIVNIEMAENIASGGREGLFELDALRRESDVEVDLPTRRRRPLRRIAPGADRTVSNVLQAFDNFDATTLNNLRASLLPLLSVLVGALPAAIAGIVALAGAAISAAAVLGSVFALGGLGVALSEDGSLTDVISNLRDSIKNAFGPIAEALRPTLLSGIDSLTAFFAELGDRALVLRTFSDDALALLDALEAVALDGVSRLIAFVDAAKPALNLFLEGLGNLRIFEALAGVLAETLPLVQGLFAIIADLIGPIIRLSIGFLFFADVLLALFSIWLNLIDAIPFGTQILGGLLSVLLLLITALSIASAVTQIWATTLTQQLITKVLASIASFKGLILQIYNYIFASGAATVSTQAFTIALAKLLGIITLGIAPVIGVLATQFAFLSSDIDQATSSLKSFQRQQGRVSEGFGNFNGGVGPQSGRGFVDVTDNRSTVIRAPDAETGTQVANTNRYRNDKLEQGTT